MKLLSLQATWFMRYKHVALDFDRDGIIGVVGPNGSGKTTLVDAVMWALYGRRRGLVEEVRHHQAPEEARTEVVVEFRLQDAVWRVVRRLSKRGSQDAFLYAGGETVVRVRGHQAVTAAVSKLLRMPEESFVRTFYAPQKQLEALSREDRREKVEELLGLGTITSAEKVVLKQVKETELVLSTARDLLPDLEALGQRRADLAEERARWRAAESQQHQDERGWETRRGAVSERRVLLETQREQDARLAEALVAQQTVQRSVREQIARVATARAGLEQDRLRLAEVVESLSECLRLESRLQELDGIAAGLERRRSLLEQQQQVVGELQTLAAQREAVIGERAGLEAARHGQAETEARRGVLGDERRALETQREALEATVHQLQEREAELRRLLQQQTRCDQQGTELEGRLGGLTLRHAALTESLAERSVQVESGERLEAELQQVTARQQELRLLVAQSLAAIAELEKTRAEIEAAGEDSSCPFCRRPYQKDFPRVRALIDSQLQHQEETRAAHEAELLLVQQRQRDVKSALLACRKRLKTLEEVAQEAQALDGQRQEVVRQVETLQAERQARMGCVAALLEPGEDGPAGLARMVTQTQGAAAERRVLEGALADLARQLSELESQWRGQAEGLAHLEARQAQLPGLAEREAAWRERLKTLEELLQRTPVLPYDAAEHQACRVALEQARPRRDEALRLQGRVQQLPDLERQAAELTRVEAEAETRAQELLAARARLGYDATVWEAVEAELAALEGAGRALAENRGRLQQGLQEAEAQQARLVVEEEAAAKAHHGFIEQEKEQRHRQLLRQLLNGYRGWHAARLRPQLEQQASALLQRITEGAYAELKLDAGYQVQVQDGQEAFRLEVMSGGEQDLVHLCLRLAISRLVAQYRGTDIQMLVLDEVLGSQDRARRQRLLEALQALGSVFRQMLIITHVPEVAGNADHLLSILDDGMGGSEASFENSLGETPKVALSNDIYTEGLTTTILPR